MRSKVGEHSVSITNAFKIVQVVMTDRDLLPGRQRKDDDRTQSLVPGTPHRSIGYLLKRI